MNIRIAGTEFSLKNHSYEIYIQGCFRDCTGCHNPDAQSFSGGKEYDIKEFLEKLYLFLEAFIKDGLVENIYVSGGDLLCQEEEKSREFSRLLKYFFPNLRLWLFTGAEEEDIPEWVFRYYHIVKCGPYREDLRNPDGTFPASSNQKLLCTYKVSYDTYIKTEFRGEKKWK